MKSIYRKTGMMVAALALLVVMYAPTAVALESISATWEDPHIKATAWGFEFKNDKNYQFRYCEPNGGTCHKGAIWTADVTTSSYTENFNVTSSGATTIYGDWTVWLYKAGDGDNSNPTEGIDSERVSVTVNVPIPEFATIAIPIVALLGLVAFCRRKQKK